MVLLLWQKIPGPLVWADGIAYWLLHVLFFVYMAGFHWVAKSLGSFDALGIKQIQRRLRNKEAIAAGTLSTYKEDDTTVSWTAAVTTTAGDPLSAVDPT